MIIVVSMELDHIVPESTGGETVVENLCLACTGCNAHKYNFESGIDPETNIETALFHPRRQSWDDHFCWSNDGTMIMGLSPCGRATVARLRMNRRDVVESRSLWVSVGWHPPVDAQ